MTIRLPIFYINYSMRACMYAGAHKRWRACIKIGGKLLLELYNTSDY